MGDKSGSRCLSHLASCSLSTLAGGCLPSTRVGVGLGVVFTGHFCRGVISYCYVYRTPMPLLALCVLCQSGGFRFDGSVQFGRDQDLSLPQLSHSFFSARARCAQLPRHPKLSLNSIAVLEERKNAS